MAIFFVGLTSKLRGFFNITFLVHHDHNFEWSKAASGLQPLAAAHSFFRECTLALRNDTDTNCKTRAQKFKKTHCFHGLTDNVLNFVAEILCDAPILEQLN